MTFRCFQSSWSRQSVFVNHLSKWPHVFYFLDFQFIIHIQMKRTASPSCIKVQPAPRPPPCQGRPPAPLRGRRCTEESAYDVDYLILTFFWNNKPLPPHIQTVWAVWGWGHSNQEIQVWWVKCGELCGWNASLASLLHTVHSSAPVTSADTLVTHSVECRCCHFH